ncbi:MAG: serpin family protein [Candidatus Helarchaeota archaeon]|nr:serpin family protein [Candidatus Helarchaeota archaeon]
MTVDIRAEEASLIASNNEFALECYNILKSNEKNLFFSPLSISICLGMLYAGAKSATAEQIASALHFEGHPDIHATFKYLIKNLNAPSRSKCYELCIANALWMQDDYKILPEYLIIVENSYFGGLSKMDFKTQWENARKKINKWVEDRTEDKIKDLLKPGMVNDLTRLVLTNAIYFLSDWNRKFKKRLTKEEPFTLINGQKVKVPTMHQKNVYVYTENQDYQAVELTYFRDELSMVIILPKKVDGITEIEKSMTPKNLTGWIRPQLIQEVDVYIPKFKITSEFKLAETLKKMGIVDAFDLDSADFSGITPRNPDLNLFVSDVIHKTYVDVNEEGTEAAAATAAVMVLGAALEVPKPTPIFKADHPFLFLIMDVKTKNILFLGRIMDPSRE